MDDRRNLVHRPLRSLISVVAIALEVNDDSADRGSALEATGQPHTTGGIGLTCWWRPPGSSFISPFRARRCRSRLEACLAKLPHVKSVAPVITQVAATGSLEIYCGRSTCPAMKACRRASTIWRAVRFKGRTTYWWTICFAKSNHAKVGGTIEILNNKFRIAGIVERGKGRASLFRWRRCRIWSAPRTRPRFSILNSTIRPMRTRWLRKSSRFRG